MSGLIVATILLMQSAHGADPSISPPCFPSNGVLRFTNNAKLAAPEGTVFELCPPELLNFKPYSVGWQQGDRLVKEDLYQRKMPTLVEKVGQSNALPEMVYAHGKDASGKQQVLAKLDVLSDPTATNQARTELHGERIELCGCRVI